MLLSHILLRYKNTVVDYHKNRLTIVIFSVVEAWWRLPTPILRPVVVGAMEKRQKWVLPGMVANYSFVKSRLWKSKSQSGTRLLLDFCWKVDFKVDFTRLLVGLNRPWLDSTSAVGPLSKALLDPQQLPSSMRLSHVWAWKPHVREYVLLVSFSGIHSRGTASSKFKNTCWGVRSEF